MRPSRLFSVATNAAPLTRGESDAGIQIAVARRRKVNIKIFGTWIVFMGEVLLTHNSTCLDVHLLELLVQYFVCREHLRLLLGYGFRNRGIDLRLFERAVSRTSGKRMHQDR